MTQKMNTRTLVVASALAFTGSVFSGSLLAITPPTLTDLNGDGVISAEEINEIRQAHKADMLNQYDADGNGELSRLEKRALKDAHYDAALVEFDADGDGELSREERRAVREARRAAVEAQLDVNQDGVVSDEERAGFEQVREARGERGGRSGKKRGKFGVDSQS